MEINELKQLATDNNIEFIWVLEEFRNRIISKINAELKGR